MKQLVLIAAALWSVACTRAEPTGPQRKLVEGAPTLSATAIRGTPVAHAANAREGRQSMMAAPRGDLDSLVLGVADCAVEDYQIAATCPGMRAFETGTRSLDAADTAAVAAHLGHASPAVRIGAATLLAKTADAASHTAIAVAGSRETDPRVLRAFVHALASSPGSARDNPQVASMFLAAADHADPAVRLEAVAALARQQGMTGAAAKLQALIERDADVTVRRAACATAGKLGDESLVAVYRRATESTTDAALHAACMEGVVAMFHDHPSFGTASEGAYRLFVERLAATPRSEASPPWTVMSAFCYLTHEPDEAKLAAWRARATWFDAPKLKQLIADVVADRAASWKARAAGIESLVGLGATKAELVALRRGLVPSHEGDKQVLAKLDSALAN